VNCPQGKRRCPGVRAKMFAVFYFHNQKAVIAFRCVEIDMDGCAELS